MNRVDIKSLVSGFLAAALVFSIFGNYNAQAAWTKSENTRFKNLERKVLELESKLIAKTPEKKTIRFTAIRGSLRICPADSYPVLDFPFSPGEGYYIPARMSDYGNFNDTVELITCAYDINQ